jgi:glycyl-tRNA synthetase beta chain
VVYDGVRVSGVAVGLPFGDETVGHRLAPDTAFSFRDAAAWLAGLRARGVEPDLAAREATVRRLLADATEEAGADPVDDDALVEEVVQLVEAPAVVLCSFDEALLVVPPRLLVETMKKNQRMFPLTRGGVLTNRFAVVTNNPWGDTDTIAAGNAAVVRSRFADARFFVREDNRKRLEEHGLRLAQMRWIRGLGTMADKQERAAALALELEHVAHADALVVARAGALAKADLATLLVGEFPNLQGHVGRLYALAQGEREEVAEAIEEAWLPRSADDAVAATPAGITLAIADRLDTIVACFGIGLVPTGGGDPQGLRRAAQGIVRTLIEHDLRADLEALSGRAVALLHAAVVRSPDGFEEWVRQRGTGAEPKDGAALVASVVEFVVARFKATRDVTGDLVDAALSGSVADPVLLDRKVAALAALAGNPEFGAILTTFKRVLNITRGQEARPPDLGECTHEAERALHRALSRTEGEVASAAAALDFGLALDRILVLREPVAALFDAVLVDSPVPAERAVRMGLLLRAARVFLSVADFSRISTR